MFDMHRELFETMENYLPLIQLLHGRQTDVILSFTSAPADRIAPELEGLEGKDPVASRSYRGDDR